MIRFFYYFLTLIFSLSSLRAEEEDLKGDLPLSDVDGGVSSIVGGCVNAITGDYIEACADLVVPGPEPLIFERFYSSADCQTKVFYDGWRHNFDTRAILRKGTIEGNGQTYLSLYYIENSGRVISFQKSKKKHHRELFYKPNISNGYTNLRGGMASAHTHIKNVSAEYDSQNKQIFIKNGSGEVLHLTKMEVEGDKIFSMDWEKKGSGNILNYGYIDANHVQKISATDSKKAITFNSITLIRPSSQDLKNDMGVCKLCSSDGRQIHYKLKKFPGDSRNGIPSTYRIHQVSGDTIPTIAYEYTKRESGFSYQISKKTLPDNRYLNIDYYKRSESKKRVDRVSKISAPVGHNQKPITTFSFSYTFHSHGHGETTVKNAYNHQSIYFYDKYYRLKQIEKYDDSNHLHHTKVFSWNEDGNLEFQQLKDHNQNILTSRHYIYDDRGNVLIDRTFGSFSGEIKPVTPAGENWSVHYKYSDDGRNLLLEEKLPTGKTTQYRYQPESDLLISKLVLNNGKICLRNFYEYDSNAVLITSIEDDGITHDKGNLTGVTQRRIQRIKPQTIQPIGLPETIDEFYVDLSNGKEIRLKRIVNTFSASGLLKKAVHYSSDLSQQYTLLWEHDAHGNIIKETNALGEKITRKFDANNNLIRERNRLGFLTENTYDFSGRLIATAEHHDGIILKTSYKYDYLNRLVEKVDPFQQVTKYTYDAFDNLVKQVLPSHNSHDKTYTPVITQKYDVLGNPVSVVDEMGNETLKRFNIRGKPVWIKHPNGTEESFVYNLNGTIQKHKTKNESILTYSYDCFDRINNITLKSPSGELLSRTHSAYTTFNKISDTDGEGFTTNYRYDFAGRLVAKSKGDELTEYSYDSWNRLESTKQWVTDSTYRITILKYDALDRVIEERQEDSEGVVHSLIGYAYDANDNKTQIIKYTNHAPQITSTEYNSLKLPILVTDPEGNQTHYTYNFDAYDRAGQKTKEITVTDALGNQTITTFNVLNKPETIIQKNSTGLLLARKELSYDNLGNLIHTKEETICNGSILGEVQTAWKYNKISQLISITEALGTTEQKLTEYTYDQYGQKSKIIKPDGTVLTHQYDAKGRLAKLTSSDLRISYSYTYSKNDDLISVQDATQTQNNLRFYDKNGRLASETLGNGFTVTYSYDRIGRPTEATLTDGSTIRYQYDGTHLKKIIRSKNNQEVYAHEYTHYDLSGSLLESRMAGNAGSIQFAYTGNGTLKEMNCATYHETLTFNKVNHVTSASTNQGDQKFTYDDLYQLSSEEGVFNHTYQHDSLYNCISKDNFEHSTNALHQIHQFKHATFTYDANGNRSKSVSDNEEIHYTYDPFDRLVELNEGSIKTIYTYDSFNRRLSKSQYEDGRLLGKTNYIYFGQNEVGSFDENGAIQELRILGIGHGAEIGAAIAIELKKDIYIPINDHNGNIVALLDLEGEQCARYTYSAFGEERTGGIVSPWRFSSKRVDEESGLINFGRRYYDPITARWLTPDPLGFEGGPNLYAYVLNSPIDHIDLYGLFGSWTEDFFSLTSCMYEWGETLLTLPGLITEMVGYHLVPLPVVRDAVMMLGRALQGQTPHFQIEWNHSRYLGAYGDGEFLFKQRNISNGILTSEENLIQRAKEMSAERNGEKIHAFYSASNGLVMDLLECLGLMIGLPLETPRLYAEFVKAQLTEMEGLGTVESVVHSQGGLMVHRAFDHIHPIDLGHMEVTTYGSAKTIDNPYLKGAINYISIYDPVPMIADSIGILKNTFKKSGNVEFITIPGLPVVEHLANGRGYARQMQQNNALARYNRTL